MVAVVELFARRDGDDGDVGCGCRSVNSSSCFDASPNPVSDANPGPITNGTPMRMAGGGVHWMLVGARSTLSRVVVCTTPPSPSRASV